jgi:hypothetical protein
MFYAVNVADLAGQDVDPFLKMLVSPVIASRITVACEHTRFDGIGVLLDCGSERAEAIVQLVRKKYKRYQVRLYRSKSGLGGWKRV